MASKPINSLHSWDLTPKDAIAVQKHLGLLLDIPSIGCAKARLSGRYEPPRREKGSYSYLNDYKSTQLT